MANRKVIQATADYTGGGVYIMSGRFASGEWFATDNTVFVELYDSDPWSAGDDTFTEEWNAVHSLGTIDGTECSDVIRAAVEYIAANDPDGNYATSEVREYFSR